jgi:hypothetical protein
MQPQVTTIIEVPTEGHVVTQNSQKQPQSTTVTKPVRKDPSKGGRPTDLTDVTVSKLVGAFQRGYTDIKACEYAEISRTTFYRWIKNDPEFSNTITHAKNFWIQEAGENITEILQSRDPAIVKTRAAMSKWVYEKHMPDVYGQKEFGKPGEGGNVQNNYLIVPDGKLRSIFEQTGIARLDPASVIKPGPAAEGNPDADLAGTAEQGSTVVVDQGASEDVHAPEQSLSTS